MMWTAQRTDKLKLFYNQGMSDPAIAKQMNTSRHVIRSKRRRLQLVLNRPSTNINPRSGPGRIIWRHGPDETVNAIMDADQRFIDAWEKHHGSLRYGAMAMKQTRPPEPMAMKPKGLPWARTPKPKPKPKLPPKITPDEFLKSYNALVQAQLTTTHISDWFAASTEPPMLKEILRAVANKHGLLVNVIISESRQKHLIAPRYECFYEMHRLTKASLTQIGRAMNRDQSTVNYGIARHAERNNLPRLDGRQA